MFVYTGGRVEYNKRITTVFVKNGVRDIAEEAFVECPKIRIITIPNSVKSIGHSAFSGLQQLEAIIIPNSVRTIGQSAFFGCTSLKAIMIPEGVTVIEEYTFLNCRSLERIQLPESLTTIGESAFESCISLKAIFIPEGTTAIETDTFRYCTSLQRIRIPNGMRKIPIWAFDGCRSLREVTLPPTIEKFEFGAFHMCSNLDNFIIPNGLPVLKDGFDPFSVGFDFITWKVVKQILGNASSLRRMTIKKIYVGEGFVIGSIKGDDILKVLELVSAGSALREVDLSGNDLSVGVFETLALQDIPGHLRLLEIQHQCPKWEEASASPEHLLGVLERNPKLVIETDKFWDDSEDGKVRHQLDMNEYGCRSFIVRDSRWPELIETLALLEKQEKLRTGASNILYNLLHRQLTVFLNYPQDNSSTNKKDGKTSVKQARPE